MQVEATEIPAVKILTPKKHGDARGFFSEVYNKAAFDHAGLDLTFVQDNHSFSAAVGTLRGLHFQTPPFAQDKLVRVARGRIVDGELAPAPDSDRLRPWVCHARARHRGSLQDNCGLFAGSRSRAGLG